MRDGAGAFCHAILGGFTLSIPQFSSIVPNSFWCAGKHEMPLYQIKDNALATLKPSSFREENLWERRDLQRLLKNNIEVIAPGVLIVAEEFGEWEESSRRIDLLGVDKNANLVVIELKRTDDGGHMELQAIRYAAMISSLSWSQVVSTYEKYLTSTTSDLDAEASLLSFLGWSEVGDEFGLSVRIILASANFSKEITTSVLWLNERDLDITCVRLSLHRLGDNLILSADQIIPLPEAQSYQIELKQKRQEERISRTNKKDRSLYTISYGGIVYEADFKKSDIGFHTVKLLEEKGLIDDALFQFLRDDTSCSFKLLKTPEEMTETERRYGKYRHINDPEIFYQGTGYYIARNWGVNNVQKFINKMKLKTPSLSFEPSDNS